MLQYIAVCCKLCERQIEAFKCTELCFGAQCVALCVQCVCSVLLCVVAACSSVLQSIAVCCSTSQCVAVVVVSCSNSLLRLSNSLKFVLVRVVLYCVAVFGSALQYV